MYLRPCPDCKSQVKLFQSLVNPAVRNGPTHHSPTTRLHPSGVTHTAGWVYARLVQLEPPQLSGELLTLGREASSTGKQAFTTTSGGWRSFGLVVLSGL